MHFGTFLTPISPKLEVIKILPKAKQKKIAYKQILKKKIIEKIDDILSRIQKIFF